MNCENLKEREWEVIILVKNRITIHTELTVEFYIWQQSWI